MNREPFVTRKRFMVIDTTTEPPKVVATFKTEQEAVDHCSKLNALRRRK